MNLLVTGGAGFIGSNFIRYILGLRDGFRITNLDKLTYAGNLSNLENISGPDYAFVKGDICDLACVLKVMRGCDAVVHFAAESHVDRSIYDPGPAVGTNIQGTCTLLQAARELSVSRFIHVSTDEVYGDLHPEGVADEKAPLAPSSPYSATKAGSDLLVQAFMRTYGLPAIITRASNNYGAYQFPEKFIPLVISNLLDQRPVPVYGDGKQQRDWLHVQDHCKALTLILKMGRLGQVYNIGGGSCVENIDIVNRLLAIVQRPKSLIQKTADRPGHDRRYALDCSKLKDELGWEPCVPLNDGLRSTVQWYVENRRWLDAVRDKDYLNYYERHYSKRAGALQDR
jgi:dTDP-glucose 4,6-dehydratase